MYTQDDAFKLFECVEEKEVVINHGNMERKDCSIQQGSFSKATSGQNNTVLGTGCFCAILFASWIRQKLPFHLSATSQSLFSNA